MMWPLLLCSVLLGAFLIERTWVVLVRPALTSRPGQDRSLTVHRRVLPFFRDIPPSLGLLGTVVGIVQSFRLVDGQLDGDTVGAGLGVACTTTIFGIAIAIVAATVSYLLDWIAAARGETETS